jgi:hypothetical protein
VQIKAAMLYRQPRALPLIKNPQGNLGGYLYIPDVSGNYATGPSVTIGSNETWEGEVDVVITQFGNYFMPMGGGDWTAGFGLLMYGGGNIRVFSKGIVSPSNPSGITLGTPLNIKYGFGSTGLYVKINDVIVSQATASQASSITHPLELNQQAALSNQGNYAIQKAKLTVNNAVVFDCDFNGSTSIRHGDTKFQAAVGGPVSLIKAGNDPVTVVKKSVLRFSSATSGLKGLFANQIDGGYMFAAFSVLGTGVASGESSGRVFSINKTGGEDFGNGGAVFSAQVGTSLNLRTISGTTIAQHNGLYDDTNGDILHSSKLLNNQQLSKVNNADAKLTTNTTTIEGDEFNIGVNEDGVRVNGENSAIDLEFLALFSADSVPDEATASKIRDYINKRNNVFSLVDNSYYFFDPQKADFTGNFTDANTLDGYITGSDLGDTDVRSNLTLVQATQNDQPSTDGYTITFNDSAEHLEFENSASQNLSGWQIVGTSLGTFAYRVQGAVTELNLLGNLGNVSYRKAGDLYGVILLPESATGREINEAKKLLTDRGASVSATAVVTTAWRGRSDIVQFDGNMSDVTYATAAWRFCSSLESFSSNLPEATNVSFAWNSCTSLSDFRTTDIKNCTDFTSAWQSCSALTSFPAGAKLGTAAENVNFQRAWESSGLTSFSTPLPTANDLFKAWNGCTSLESFSAPLTSATLINYAWNGCTSLNRFNSQLSSVVLANNAWQNCSSLTDFTTTDIKNCTNFTSAWQNCSALQSFPAGAKLGTEATGYVNFTDAWRSSGLTSFNTPLTTAVNVTSAWRDNLSLTSFSTPLPSATDITVSWYNCTALTDFSADVFATWNPSSITSGVFNLAWVNCPLTAQSVENILTSIDSSGHFATTNKVSGGTPIADAGIDIDYDGTTLSAATNAAVTSLKSKGWSIIVNNVTL